MCGYARRKSVIRWAAAAKYPRTSKQTKGHKFRCQSKGEQTYVPFFLFLFLGLPFSFQTPFSFTANSEKNFLVDIRRRRRRRVRPSSLDRKTTPAPNELQIVVVQYNNNNNNNAHTRVFRVFSLLNLIYIYTYINIWLIKASIIRDPPYYNDTAAFIERNYCRLCTRDQ